MAWAIGGEKNRRVSPAAGIFDNLQGYRQVALAVAVIAPATMTVFAPFFTCF